MRVVNIDNLEWIQVTVKELEDKAMLILKPHINDLDWFEAEPVRHGRWINPRLNKYGHPCHQCNQCLFVASQKDRNFCPDCGAKMDLKE